MLYELERSANLQTKKVVLDRKNHYVDGIFCKVFSCWKSSEQRQIFDDVRQKPGIILEGNRQKMLPVIRHAKKPNTPSKRFLWKVSRCGRIPSCT
jgi:hypothetical protein